VRGINGRRAVVTGGGRGIGAAIAKRLAAEGAHVAVLDLSEEAAAPTVEAIVGEGGRSVAIACDVSDESLVVRAFEQVNDALGGGPDILINNAGITKDAMLFKMTVEQWDAVQAVHLRGTFLCTREAQKTMVSGGWGRVVNLSSTSALGNRGQANYSTAKAGVQGFTKTAAIELGRYGITVNAIAPGFIVTDMTRAAAESLGQSWEEYEKATVARIAVGRGGTPEDVAGLTAFLASEDASFITGQVIYLTGQPRT
jgi:3-oxoacyl-[acyl-carrier protein] reductase